jgi:hypothetical protein
MGNNSEQTWSICADLTVHLFSLSHTLRISGFIMAKEIVVTSGQHVLKSRPLFRYSGQIFPTPSL